MMVCFHLGRRAFSVGLVRDRRWRCGWCLERVVWVSGGFALGVTLERV